MLGRKLDTIFEYPMNKKDEKGELDGPTDYRPASSSYPVKTQRN
jgi:hypothetical protein